MSMVNIRRGDTLGRLVARYNRENGTSLTVGQVAQANGIRDPNKIRAGTQLIFPDAFEQQAPRNQVIRNAQNENLVRNGVSENVEVRDPQGGIVLPEAVREPFTRLATQRPQVAEKALEQMGTVTGRTDAERVANMGPELRSFYDSLLRTNRPAAQALLGMLQQRQPQPNNTPQLNPLLDSPLPPTTVDPTNQELLRQQRLQILA